MKHLLHHSALEKIIFLSFSLILFYTCGSIPKEVKGYLNGLDDKQEITFNAKKGDKVIAQLITPKTGNIRINQITSPTGKSDGPFSQELEYDIDESGTWKITIAGSLMEGDSYFGDFTVRLKVNN
ncbi:hypothetical protein M2138_000985 [Dysgonomonadaceae bacterium PH5-43]|nr:hypothetical protein [Dysgonomonadaceae bacterium PH5-43]